MHRIKYLLIFLTFLFACNKKDKTTVSPLTGWDKIKAEASLQVELTSQFSTPFRQSLSTTGWEDGVEISKDGLHLYCTYAPGDLLSWTLNSVDPTEFKPYQRGPAFGMDLVTNPVGANSWLQSDILIANRTSVNEKFTSWNLSNMARPVFSEGAPSPYDNSFIVFTSNDKGPPYDTDIWRIEGQPNPTGIGEPLPNFPNTNNNEDNPHIERLSIQELVLFFDSDSYPGGKGGHDIWYSTSDNNGNTWSTPANVTSINTDSKEHQPYLYKDKNGDWFLYFSAFHSDGKLAIFYSKQKIKNDWDSWDTKQLVISAGNTSGLGEPSLTEDGDLSFVVVYESPDGTQYDHYDSDPWFLPKKK